MFSPGGKLFFTSLACKRALWSSIPSCNVSFAKPDSRTLTTDTTTMGDEVTVDYVQSVECDKNVLLVDVREPAELEKTGKIPGSVNIPLACLEDTLQNLNEEGFRKKYNRDKPNLESTIVFSCHMGRRSQAALEAAKKMGFVNAKHFPGGWAGWEQATKC